MNIKFILLESPTCEEALGCQDVVCWLREQLQPANLLHLYLMYQYCLCYKTIQLEKKSFHYL